MVSNRAGEKRCMSISGYLCKPGQELRMPRERDSLGIRFDGSVLNGEKSVEQSRNEDAILAGPGVPSGGSILSEVLSGKPESPTRTNAFSPAERMHLRLPGKF